MKYNSQVFESFVHFTHQAERETSRKVVELKSNKGGEYLLTRMRVWCRRHGIKQTCGPPHTPQLNGVAERYNQTLLDCMKPSLKHSKPPHSHWSDCLSYSVCTTNQSPTFTNNGFKNSCELSKGKPPSMRHAHMFGSKGVYLLPSANRCKVDYYPHNFYFLGVLPRGDGVAVLDVISNRQV